MSFALALLLTCTACSQEDAPADEVAEAAEEIVAPAEPTPLARGKWAPQDDCAAVEGADAFRERLAAAVEARDADALVALAADDIKLDFGGGEGAAELRGRLEASGELWDELGKLLALGCSANEEGGVTIPWIFDQDLGEADPFTTFLVVGEDVPVFTGPDGDRRKGSISWDLVEIASLDPQRPLQGVTLPGGTHGFIDMDRLRSLIDYRLIASSRNGRWRITAFIAGD